MNPKEIVYRAIEFRNPPRLPITYCNRDFDSSDTLGTGFLPAAGFTPSEPGMTEWGYVWHTLDGTMGQPSTHPLLDDAALSTYQPPDPYAPGRFADLPAFIAQNRDKFLRFGLGITGFNTATFLRGFDQLLMDLYAAPEIANQVLDYVFNFENGIIRQAVHYDVDAICFGDDWGTQRGLMIAPALWRKLFRPRYAEQFAIAHQAGKKVWFHSCGNVHAIIGDLIEIGVDVLELLQPDIFGVEQLAHEFGGKVCFCCSVDHQRRAVSGTRDEIFAYARLLRDQLGAFNGGFIGYIEDYGSLGMSEQNYQWIRQAFHGLNAGLAQGYSS
jgi:uroporphyrinogen decarboxylase